MLQSIREYCRVKNWLIRLPLLLGMIYLAWMYLTVEEYYSLIDMADFVFHEVGHVVFGLFNNMVLGIAGGTLMQLLVPIYAMGNFLWTKDYFGLGIAQFWLGISLLDVGHYVSDARAMDMSLVPLLSANPIHDWHWLLGNYGWLEYDLIIGSVVRNIGWVFIFFGLVFELLLMGLMMKRKTGVSSF